MAPAASSNQAEHVLKPGVNMPAVGLLLAAAMGVSVGYGMLLLLPLYVQHLGGNEADFGVILSSAVIPAVVCLGILTRYPEALRPHWVLALAIGCFAVGSGGAWLVTSRWEPLVGVGVLLGTAWAVVYTVAPMVMSAMVTDPSRATYFGFLTGSEQLGIGAGPVIAGVLVQTPLGFRGTFLTAGIICVAAVVCTVAVGIVTPDARATQTAQTQAAVPSLRAATGQILRSQAAVWLVIIALFACLFTAMTQFQTTFAAARGLDYSIFYITYTIAVIFVRFVGGSWAARYDTQLVIATSVSVMTVAVASFLLIGSNPIAYTAATVFLGLGYGLALPAVQAHAVNVSADAVRPRVLPLAGLVFQAAILSFPLAAGWMIVSFGYWLLFVVLLSVAAVQTAICWRQVLRHRVSSTSPEATTS